MKKIQVMTDTVAGVPKELTLEYNIKVVPAANILVNGRTYIEGIDLSISEAYQLIERDPDRFITSAISPGFLVDTYRELSKNSQEIFFITLSSALSAVSRTAQLASESLREELPQIRVKVFDSKTCSGAQGLIVLAAARAAQKGCSLEQITGIAEKVRENCGYLVLLDTLRYVYRTGRMSKMASRLASFFNIKPISRVSSAGTLDYVTRVRKREDGVQKLLELIQQDKGTQALHFWVMHADAPEFAEQFCQRLRERLNCLSIITSEYSPVMGYGTGRGALSVGFHPELNLFQ